MEEEKEILPSLDELCLCLACTMPEECRKQVDEMFFGDPKNFERLDFIEKNSKGTKRITSRLTLEHADTLYKLQCICDIFALSEMPENEEKVQRAYNMVSKLVNLLKSYSYDTYRYIKKHQNECIHLAEYFMKKYYMSERQLSSIDTYSSSPELIFDSICAHIYLIFFACCDTDDSTEKIFLIVKHLYKQFISADQNYDTIDSTFEKIYGFAIPTNVEGAINDFVHSPITMNFFGSLGFFEMYNEKEYLSLGHVFRACSKDNTISATGIGIALFDTIEMLEGDLSFNEGLAIRGFYNQLANKYKYYYDLIFDTSKITVKALIRRIFLLMIQTQERSEEEMMKFLRNKGTTFKWELNPLCPDPIVFIETGIGASYFASVAMQNIETKRFILDVYGPTSLIKQKRSETLLFNQAKELQSLANNLALQKSLLEQSKQDIELKVQKELKKATDNSNKKIAELQEEIRKLTKANDKLKNDNAELMDNIHKHETMEKMLLESLEKEKPEESELPSTEEMIETLKKHKFTIIGFENTLKHLSTLFDFDAITSERDKIEKKYTTECIFVLTKSCSHALFYKITSLKYPYYFVNAKNTDAIIAEIYKYFTNI